MATHKRKLEDITARENSFQQQEEVFNAAIKKMKNAFCGERNAVNVDITFANASITQTASNIKLIYDQMLLE